MKEAKHYDVLRFPVVTEKSSLLSAHGQYVFKVQKNATKHQIKKAIEHVFNVKVEKVRTILIKGKIVRFRGMSGTRSDYKKAIVSLAKGQTIELAGA